MPKETLKLGPVITVRPPSDKDEEVNVSVEGISKPEQKVIDAIGWLHAIGQEQPRKEAVALIAGVRPTSGGFKNVCGSLRSKGLVTYHTPNTVSLMRAGEDAVNSDAIPSMSTNEEFHREVLSKLSGPEQKVLTPLLENGGEAMTKDELAALTPYQSTSGGYKNILGTLRSMGLIDYPLPGTVKAEQLMFPFDV